MASKIHTYESDELTVEYELARCIHAEECVKGLPQVFDASRRPWIAPGEASAEQVADVVRRCPTGALRYAPKRDGGPEERPSLPNTVRIVPDGPLYVSGDLAIKQPDGGGAREQARIALCRCGASSHKPFCDGSHSKVGFKDTGVAAPPRGRSGDQPAPARLELTPLPNGPVRFEGELAVEDSTGAVQRSSAGKFCRCGQSQAKPYCDGTHRSVGFEAD